MIFRTHEVCNGFAGFGGICLLSDLAFVPNLSLERGCTVNLLGSIEFKMRIYNYKSSSCAFPPKSSFPVSVTHT